MNAGPLTAGHLILVPFCFTCLCFRSVLFIQQTVLLCVGSLISFSALCPVCDYVVSLCKVSALPSVQSCFWV